MDWREKSVTLGNVQKERFNTRLAHVTVSETRITVAYKDAEDWKRIRREVGTDILLEETALEDVQDVDVSEEHLYYPHINLTVATEDGKEEKRIYFMEDEEDDLEACLKAIRRFWNAQRQRGAPHRDSYTYGEEDGDEAETDDAAGDEGGAEEEGSDDEETAPDPESGGGEGAAEEVELTAALKRQNSLTHRLSEGIKNEAAHFKDLLTGSGDAEEEAETGAEQDAEEGGDEAETKGVAERISDEVRSEIDRFRHIGEDGNPKEEEEDEEEEEADEDDADDTGRDTEGEDDADDTEDQEEEESPVEDVVDRFMGQ